MRAAQEFRAKSVILCGGVAANRALRRNLQLTTNNLHLRFFVPPFAYNTDNAAMIAAAAYVSYLRKKRYRLAANGGLGL
jgi:N6-L-threonylcarbamoyladenine synthase